MTWEEAVKAVGVDKEMYLPPGRSVMHIPFDDYEYKHRTCYDILWIIARPIHILHFDVFSSTRTYASPHNCQFSELESRVYYHGAFS